MPQVMCRPWFAGIGWANKPEPAVMPGARRRFEVRASLVADEARSSGPRLDRGQDSSEPGHAAGGVVAKPCDAELVRRLGDADRAALSELYHRFGRPCYSLARQICADEGLAEDVVQEVFWALWREPTRFDPSEDDFAVWLLTMTHRRAVDAVREQTTSRRGVLTALEAGEDWSPTQLPATNAATVARVAASRVRAALDRLPVEQRQVLALAYFGGHTQREIAVLTGVPLSTVQSRTWAAVQRLRSLLTDQVDPGALVAEAHLVREVVNR
jgi:RNA polymerase sigma factor (sigma-70 family)